MTAQAEAKAVARPDSRQPKRRTRRPARWLRQRQGILVGVSSIVVFLVLWEVVASLRLAPELFLPGPSDVWDAFVFWWHGSFWIDVWVSTQEFLFGYAAAIVIGLPIGFLMGWFRPVRQVLNPFVSFLYASPRIAFVPLFIIWLGIGTVSKVAVVFLGAVFPIIINAEAGLRNIDPDLVVVARSFAANDRQVFRTIAVPGSIPFILTGLRLAVGHAVVGVFVGELVAATHGVGFMMTNAASVFNTAAVFAGLVVLAGTGIVLQGGVQLLERKFQPWKPTG